MFTTYPTYSTYRTLKRTSPPQVGEDVFALQTALLALGYPLQPVPGEEKGTDGVLGLDTADGIKFVQGKLGITVDGLCGGGTQEAIVRKLAVKYSGQHSLPNLLMFGQVMHESSCRLGNYSPARPAGDYDAGVTQRNTAHTAPRDGFTVPLSMGALAMNLRKYYDKYAGVADNRRRWMLACGSWNAPAYANFIANEEGAKVPVRETAKVGPTARAALEAYMASASAFMERLI